MAMDPQQGQGAPPLSGEVLPPPGSPPPYAPPINPLAVASLITGIAASATAQFSWVCCGAFGGLPALVLGPIAAVCGHISLKQIGRSPGAGQSRGIAIAGLITGYAGIAQGLLIMPLWAAFITMMGDSPIPQGS
jgi:hypothetical protein